MVRAQPLEVLLSELRARKLPTWGRKDQITSRVYSALLAEGRALSSEESAAVDAELGLEVGGPAYGSSSDSDDGVGPEEEDEAVASRELERNPLLALQASPSGRFLSDAHYERLLSNAASLQLFFLWGGTAPNGIKHTTSCVVRTSKSVWLFECGEDSQRHLGRNQAIGWAKLDRIFVSSLASDNIAGLPGMLCTISAAREKGHESSDTPLHVYGPVGIADYINAMLTVSRTYLEIPVIIHEFGTAALPPGQLGELEKINQRARLYRTRMPPDQLNPDGYVSAEVRTMLSRHTRRKMNTGIDERAGTLPLALPGPGDPARSGLTVAELTWTLKLDHEWLVRVAPLRAKQPSFGFLLQEADRAGRLYPERAAALGVEPGVDYTRLKNGESVVAADGSTVNPWQCVGAPRRGRRVAVVGACLDSAPFAAAVANLPTSVPGSVAMYTGPDGATSLHGEGQPPCDVVVHSMGYPAGAAGVPQTAAALAGSTAAALAAKELVLWQHQAAFVDAPEGADPAVPAQVVAAARAAFGSGSVALAGCYWCHQPDRDELE